MGHKMKERVASEPSYILKDLDKAAETAMFYGFTPVKSPKISKEDLDKASAFREEKKLAEFRSDIFPKPEEKISFLRTYLEWDLPTVEHPVMIYYKRPFGGTNERKSSSEHHSGLDIVGSLSSVCEAIAIKTAYAILSDYGYNDLVVDINSIGDKDSISRLESELSSYIKKHSDSIPSDLKQSFKKNPFEAMFSDHGDWLPAKERMPQPMSCLSESSIGHFKEVLEYLETLEIPYRVSHHLVPNRHCCSHTFFEIKSNAQEAETGSEAEKGQKSAGAASNIFAVGTRHNHLTKKVGFKKDMPIMSVNLKFKKPSVEPKLFSKNKPRPKFYFIQFGSKAKLKSLSVIETLRQARIPVHHSLTHDQFVSQLSIAEKVGAPFVIIMGQKEALENTVVVRHVTTRVQETVPIHELAMHLSRLK